MPSGTGPEDFSLDVAMWEFRSDYVIAVSLGKARAERQGECITGRVSDRPKDVKVGLPALCDAAITLKEQSARRYDQVLSQCR